jgi:GNAT superfamily N-acetyltransferase
MATVAVQVRKVESAADFRAFFTFPWTLYKHDPNWVPPLLSMRRSVFDKQHNPAWQEYLEGDYFCAWRGTELVGTIAAYINHRHNEFHNERIGWFGAFECIDDQAVADALLQTAEDWVRAKGYPTLRGPQTFTTHEAVGLLVENFSSPLVEMPYNLPYYGALIEARGLHKVMDMYSFYLNQGQAKETGLIARLDRLSGGIMKRSKITIRPADPKQMKREVNLIKEIYDTAWEKNWGFVPLTPKELEAFAESLGQLIDPRMLFFAECEGEMAGFIIAVPDMNQVIKRAYPQPGVPEIFTLAKILWHWKVRPIINGVRVPLMGVKPAFRGRGVDAVMYAYILRAIIECDYFHSDAGWILETNQAMVSIANNFGSTIYKTYRMYEKAL